MKARASPVAYAPMATTSPVHATLFTGVYPATHGVLKNGIPLGAKLPMLAETLVARGYQTAAVVSSFALDAKWGLARGFATWDDDFSREGSTVSAIEWEGVPRSVAASARWSKPSATGALAWLERARRPEEPFLPLRALLRSARSLRSGRRAGASASGATIRLPRRSRGRSRATTARSRSWIRRWAASWTAWQSSASRATRSS